MKKKHIIFICIVIIIICISLMLLKLFKAYNYQATKNDAIKFLSNNINQLEKLSNESILNKDKESKKYKKTSYSYYKNSDNKEYIQFDIDAQGMLGGQYWGIIYSPNDDFLNADTINIYDENQETGNGNNIYIREKIKDKWYFYYDDYDGKVDLESIK